MGEKPKLPRAKVFCQLATANRPEHATGRDAERAQGGQGEDAPTPAAMRCNDGHGPEHERLQAQLRVGRQRRQGKPRGEREGRRQRHSHGGNAHAQGDGEDQQEVGRQGDVGDAQPRHEDRHRQGDHRRRGARNHMAHAGGAHQGHASHALHQHREGRPPAEIVEALGQPRQQRSQHRRRQGQAIENCDGEPLGMVEDGAPQGRPGFPTLGKGPPCLHMLHRIVGRERKG